MDIQNQPTTPMPPAPVQQKPHHTMRNSLIVLAILVMSVVGYMSYQNPELFRAAITGGTSKPSPATQLYIPADYSIQPGGNGDIEVKAGVALAKLGTNNNDIYLVFLYDANKINISKAFTNTGDAFHGLPSTPASTSGIFTIVFPNFTPSKDVAADATLFRMSVSAQSGFTTGSAEIALDPDSHVYLDTLQVHPSFTRGTITVGTGADYCKTAGCNEHSTCDAEARKCVCNKGYDQTYLCTACSTGYTGYPDCKKDVLSNVSGIVLTFSSDTISKLTAPDRVKAYGSAFVLISSSAAAGKKITLDGQTVTLKTPAVGANEKAMAIDLTNDLATKLEALVIDIDPGAGTNNVPIVSVQKYTNIPGLLKLTATVNNVDGSLDGMTTDSGEIIIAPGLDKQITLNPAASYQLRVIGKNNIDTDVTALDINFNNVKWQPQPVNRLSSTALAGGLLEKGDKSGVTPLYAQIEKADTSKIDSNQISIEVPSGPIIEYIHIIGSKPIERAGRVTLSSKISDVDQISDIKDIRTSIVRSAQTTYSGIHGDSSAVWFTAAPVKTEVKTTDSGTQAKPADGQQTANPPATTVTENYRIYSIPVEIPQDSNMTDGPYKLVLELTDTAGHVASSVLPINIGAVATGDVDGNGKVTMLDVIAAFQIANSSNLNPTQSQLQAADMDKNGKVTMLDVINLFNQLK